MASTLADLAQVSEDPIQAGVLELFLQYWDALALIPYETIGDLTVKSARMAALPTVGYRAINGTYTESTGRFEQLEETLSILGGDTDTDVQLEGNKSQMVDMGAINTRMKIKALSYRVGNDFINGDKATTPLGVDGLFVRIGNLPARQLVSGDGGTDSLKIYASAANLNAFFDRLSEAIFRLEGGVCNAIFGDETSIQGIFSALRRISVPANQGDTMSIIVGGTKLHVPTLQIAGQTIPLINAGYSDETEATRVMSITEATGDGGTDGTSLVLVRWDGEGQFSGIQKHELQTRDLGELQTQPARRVRIEWPHGYVNFNDRSLVRINHLRFAAS